MGARRGPLLDGWGHSRSVVSEPQSCLCFRLIQAWTQARLHHSLLPNPLKIDAKGSLCSRCHACCSGASISAWASCCRCLDVSVSVSRPILLPRRPWLLFPVCCPFPLSVLRAVTQRPCCALCLLSNPICCRSTERRLANCSFCAMCLFSQIPHSEGCCELLAVQMSARAEPSCKPLSTRASRRLCRNQAQARPLRVCLVARLCEQCLSTHSLGGFLHWTFLQPNEAGTNKITTCTGTDVQMYTICNTLLSGTVSPRNTCIIMEPGLYVDTNNAPRYKQ